MINRVNRWHQTKCKCLGAQRPHTLTAWTKEKLRWNENNLLKHIFSMQKNEALNREKEKHKKWKAFWYIGWPNIDTLVVILQKKEKKNAWRHRNKTMPQVLSNRCWSHSSKPQLWMSAVNTTFNIYIHCMKPWTAWLKQSDSTGVLMQSILILYHMPQTRISL